MDLEKQVQILEKRIYNLKNRPYYNVYKIGRLRDRVLKLEKQIRDFKSKNIFSAIFGGKIIGGVKWFTKKFQKKN